MAILELDPTDVSTWPYWMTLKQVEMALQVSRPVLVAMLSGEEPILPSTIINRHKSGKRVHRRVKRDDVLNLSPSVVESPDEFDIDSDNDEE